MIDYSVNNILIHQMGKVGSTTLLRTLRQTFDDINTYHAHHLSPTEISLLMEDVTDIPNTNEGNLCKVSILEQLKRGSELYKKLQNEIYLVVTGIREPFGHMMSCLFQQTRLLFPEAMDQNLSEDIKIEVISARIKDYFHRFMIEGNAPNGWKQRRFKLLFSRFNDWWQQEYIPVHGIDILTLPDATSDYWIIEHDKRKFFIYRFEKLNLIIPHLVSYIRPHAIPVQINDNMTSKKIWGDLYKKILRKFELTPEMRQFYQNNPYAHKFYP